jgi:hypothetical protein
LKSIWKQKREANKNDDVTAKKWNGNIRIKERIALRVRR